MYVYHAFQVFMLTNKINVRYSANLLTYIENLLGLYYLHVYIYADSINLTNSLHLHCRGKKRIQFTILIALLAVSLQCSHQVKSLVIKTPKS